jgi:DNA-binding IclR family transcriptional regulator
VIDVLNLLTAHPTEAFSLAEIARHVGLTNGSAHRILTTMAGARFLSRDEKRRTYSLGVAVVAIGQAAVEKHGGIEVARSELGRLAAQLNVQCSANTVIEEEILVLVKAGKPQSHRGLTRVGERRPLVPPMGLCHVAWSGEAALDAYLKRSGAYLPESARERLHAALPLIRSRGYALAANGSDFGHKREALAPAAGKVQDEAYWSSVFGMVSRLTPNEMQIVDPADANEKGISYIAAPVFSPSGAVSLQLVITGLPTTLSVAEIDRYAEKLCAVAATITSETYGRPPEPDM